MLRFYQSIEARKPASFHFARTIYTLGLSVSQWNNKASGNFANASGYTVSTSHLHRLRPKVPIKRVGTRDIVRPSTKLSILTKC